MLTLGIYLLVKIHMGQVQMPLPGHVEHSEMTLYSRENKAGGTHLGMCQQRHTPHSQNRRL